MERNNIWIGVAAGAALIGAAYLLNKRSRFNLQYVVDEAEHLISGIRRKLSGEEPSADDRLSFSNHDGQHLAQKVRHRVEHKFASSRRHM